MMRWLLGKLRKNPKKEKMAQRFQTWDYEGVYYGFFFSIQTETFLNWLEKRA